MEPLINLNTVEYSENWGDFIVVGLGILLVENKWNKYINIKIIVEICKNWKS